MERLIDQPTRECEVHGRNEYGTIQKLSSDYELLSQSEEKKQLRHRPMKVPRCLSDTLIVESSPFLFVFGMLTLVGFVFGIFLVQRNSPVRPRFYDPVLLSSSPDTAFNITLFGDSLIRHTFIKYKFAQNIQSNLPSSLAINYYNEGVDNDTIERLSKRISQALSHNPKIIILLFDSDCSDYDMQNTIEAEQAVETQYQTRLSDVLTQLLNHTSVEYILLAGPGLLGEGPLFLNHRFRDTNKSKMVNIYRSLNEEVVNHFPANQIDYVDIHTVLFQALPWYWILGWGYVTTDGEHLNALGSKIVAKVLAEKIQTFLLAPPSSQTQQQQP